MTSCCTTELQAREAGELVYHGHHGQAWCLCPRCTAHHASRTKRRTKHDRWALDGQDWRIKADLGRA